jgi:hypothetical protein
LRVRGERDLQRWNLLHTHFLRPGYVRNPEQRLRHHAKLRELYKRGRVRGQYLLYADHGLRRDDGCDLGWL